MIFFKSTAVGVAYMLGAVDFFDLVNSVKSESQNLI